MLYIVWNYKYTPVIVLPEDWLFPIGSIFRWPTGVEGGISTTIWVLITGTVARLTQQIFNELYLLRN